MPTMAASRRSKRGGGFQDLGGDLARLVKGKNVIPALVVVWGLCLVLFSLRDVANKPAQVGEVVWEEERPESMTLEQRMKDDAFKGGLVLKGHMWCYDTDTLNLPEEEKGKTQCMCETGWSGDNCTTPVCEPACERGRCLRPGKCMCPRFWRGRACEQPICDQACRHGECTEPGTCTCEDGWHGATCQVHCENGEFGDDILGGEGNSAPNPCTCKPGWHGTACNRPDCSRSGCKNGICSAPNECSCDAGWSGRDCSVDNLAMRAQNLLSGVSPRDHRLSSVILNRGSRPDSWRQLKLWTSHLPPQFAVSRWRLVDFVPVNDTIAGKNRYSTGAERWERCAVVADGNGLLSTHLGAVIDKHHAVLRFNAAPTSKLEDHVGRRTTFRLLNRKSAFNLATKAMLPAKKRKELWGQSPGVHNPSILLWRPETYHLYPQIRKRLPNEDLNIMRTEFLHATTQMYRVVLERTIKSGIMNGVYDVADEDRDLRVPEDGQGDQTVVGGKLRVPTSIVGVAFMMQLCKQVNLFGFDPPSVRERVRNMGLRQSAYYDNVAGSGGPAGMVELSREDGDEVDFLSPLNDPKMPGQRAHPKESVIVEGEQPSGERVPGLGGKALGGHFDYFLLRLLELHNLVKICYTDHPERCLSTWKAESGV